MPRGPVPKDPDKRLRRNAPTFEQVELGGEPVAGAPPLPGRSKFLRQTRAWYEVWASSSQASQFLSTDWQRLHMLAPTVNDYYGTTDPAMRARLFKIIEESERRLGATAYDRMALRWRGRAAPAASAEEPAGGGEPARPAPRAGEDPRLRVVGGGKA